MAALIRQAAKMYQKAVHTSLAQYGLRYEDLLNECNPDVEKALKYLPKDELIARDRRLARAQDLSFKHELLPADIQAVQTPGKPYLAPIMAELKKIREEREEMKIN